MTSPDAGAASPRRSLLDWKAVVGLLISAAALWYTFSRMELANVWEDLRRADPLLMLASAAAVTGVFWIRAWRWKAILAPTASVPFRSRFEAVTIGFMGNNVLPARVGEFMRAYALSRKEPVPLVASFASLVIERLFDGILVVMLLFVAMSMPGFPEFSAADTITLPGIGLAFTLAGLARGVATVVGAVLLVLILLVSFPRPAVAALESMVRILPVRMRRPIVDALEAFLTGVAVLRDPLLLTRVSLWSLALWLFNAFGCWIAFRAFGFDLPFVAAVFFQSAIALAVSIPSGPGFVGVYHGMAVFVLDTLWDESASAAGAFAISFHLAGFIPVTVIGLYYAWRMGLSLAEVKGSEEQVEIEVERVTGVDPADPRRRPRSS